jgi:ATP-dependent DNA helicase DinG
MARAVWETFDGGGVLLAEAGTGTGKSLAYLLPAAHLGHRVVVSTGTKALQEQLALKDLPLLKSLLGRPIKTVVMKGRANYLCLHYYRQFETQPLLDVASEARHLKKLRRWAESTSAGDKAEWEGIPEDLALWRDINARSDRCLGSHCPVYDACFVVKLRCQAEAADLVVVNHHLLFADLALRQRWDAAALPQFAYLVLDEAHEAEGAAISFFGATVSRRMLSELCKDAQKVTSVVSEGPVDAAVRSLSATGAAFFDLLGAGPGRQILLPGSLDAGQRRARAALERDLLALAASLDSLSASAPETLGLVERAETLREGLLEVLDGEGEDRVRWVEVTGYNTVLSSNPIEVGDLLRQRLFGNLRAAVLTSATLTVAGSFAFVRGALGIPDEVRELSVGSPFDFARQGLCFVPAHFPEPQEEGFTGAFLEMALALVEAARGRAFVLCTSRRGVDAAAEYFRTFCGYPLLVQGQEPKGLLLNRFKEAGNAVLVGTSSFWQGVDVQGEALSLVVLDKIPFAVPTEPLVAARIALLRKRKVDPFHTYQLPTAAILMRQGAGRLIRSTKDRGVVACTDVRLRTRRYGKVLRDSLPPFPLTDDLDAIRKFFEGEGKDGCE